MNFQKFTTFKTILIALVLTINANQLFAQTTNGIFFQAVARDNFSNPAKDRKIYVQSSIIQTTPTGTKVLTEEHQANTDATGVFSISLGNGVRVGGAASRHSIQANAADQPGWSRAAGNYGMGGKSIHNDHTDAEGTQGVVIFRTWSV